MKIIYHCFGGTHSSIVAAAIHLGWLPADRLPAVTEILAVPHFDRRPLGEEGKILFLGEDVWGNKVYAAGKRGMGPAYQNFLYSLVEALGLPREELVLLDTSPLVNWPMIIGGFISRRLRVPLIGRPLVIWGVRRAFFRLASFVEENRRLWEKSRP
ncbi:MAG: DUF3189 family protein [Moorellaceae bacterium]